MRGGEVGSPLGSPDIFLHPTIRESVGQLISGAATVTAAIIEGQPTTNTENITLPINVQLVEHKIIGIPASDMKMDNKMRRFLLGEK